MMNKKIRRISFNLNKDIYNQIQNLSFKKGISSARIIREWITETNTSSFVINKVTTIGKSTNYTLRIDNYNFTKINNIAIELNISASDYIRSIIYTNLFKTIRNKENEDRNVNELYQKGKFAELIHFIGKDLNKLKDKELIFYLRAVTELNNHNLKDQVESHLLQKYNAKNVEIYEELLISKIHLSIISRDISSARDLIKNAFSYQFREYSRRTQGILFYQLGYTHLYSEEFNLAYKYYLKALEYFDIVNYPNEIAKIYMSIARIYEYQMNYKMSNWYFNKSFEILKQTNHIYYLGWYFVNKGVNDFLQYKIEDGIQDTQKSAELYNLNHSTKGQYYTLETFAKLSMLNNQNDKAYLLFTKSEKADMNFRPASGFSYSCLYKLFIESKDNYDNSLIRIEKMFAGKEKELWNNLGKYIFYSIKYINATFGSESLEGELKLKQLTTEGSYPLIREAARQTLIQKKIQPIR